jgi:flavodoxin short chain
MENISIIYWTGTGNTEKMAHFINEGLKSKGVNPKLLNISQASISDIENADLVVLGSPSMGAEVIEEDEMEPFMEEIKMIISGKKVALFGSYGWGDGKWMRNWEERMKGYGAALIGEGLIVNDAPKGEDAQRCIEFGRALA